MINKIIFLNGTIETLNHFSYELSLYFQKKGYRIYFYTMDENKQQALYSFIENKQTALITFNFVGLSGERDFIGNGSKSIWEECEVRIIQFLVDHPLYYVKGLKNQIPNMHIYCIDKNHMSFLKKYYPMQEVSFLPLAGNETIEQDVFENYGEKTEKNERKREDEGVNREEYSPYEKRKYELIFLGNCARLPSFYEKIRYLDKEYQDFYSHIYEKSIENLKIPIEELLEESLKHEMPDLDKKECLIGMEALLFIDIYRRDYVRRKVIRTLIKAGSKIHLIGKDWDSLNMDEYKNLSFTTKMVTSSDCIRFLRQAKMSLNIMPGFMEGSHDRIFSSMLAQSCVITDESNYLMRICKQQKELIYYKIDEIDKLPDLIHKHQKQIELTKEIAMSGYRYAKQFQTWEQKGRKIEELF